MKNFHYLIPIIFILSIFLFISDASAQTVFPNESNYQDGAFKATVFKGSTQQTIDLVSNASELYLHSSVDKYTISSGEVVNFTIGVENCGSLPIINIDVIDRETKNTVYSNAENIPAGTIQQIFFALSVNKTGMKDFDVIATFSDNHTFMNDTSVQITVLDPLTDIDVKLTSDKDTVPAGDTIKFYIEVKNNATQPIRAVDLVYEQASYIRHISIPQGGVKSFEINLTIDQVCDVAFTVNAVFEDNTQCTNKTNMIPINISSQARGLDPEFSDDDNSVEEIDQPEVEENIQTENEVQALDETSEQQIEISNEQENVQTNQTDDMRDALLQNAKQDQERRTLMTVLYAMLGLCTVGAVTLLAMLVYKLRNR